ncbi:MAG: Gfo/Idh/MocA family oxidoreductase [Verrucomicrobia bacterium]|nr:Gfo/Idh/MocA family oxidoreductase [Verrucomicrobiota bacterium]
MSTKPASITRRRFLTDSTKAATAIAAANLLLRPGRAPGAPRRLSPNEKLNIAFIGVGGQGGADLDSVTRAEDVNVVALCDVDENRLNSAGAKFPAAKRYRDYRKLLETEKSVDAVTMGIPDHSHAPASMMAIKLGRHVYCEKPLTRTVKEARALTLAAREAKVATQMGNQGMAFEGNRLINEWLDDGAIGAVREVHVWSDRPTHRGKLPFWWPQGVDRPTDTPPVPATLDWDLWLGPAPMRAYHPAYVPFKWRGWWDYGSGGLGDMGIHNLAPVFSALKLGAPASVQASSTPIFPDSVPVANVVHYEFAARGELPPVKLHWYDGGIMPPRPVELEDGRELNREDGIIFVGDKGKMLVTGWGGENPRLIPESRNRDYQRPPKTLPRSVGHHKEWLLACRTGSPTRSNFDFAGPLTEAVLLGVVCVRNGGDKLLWDSAKVATNEPEANRFLHYEYRKGWEL